MTFYKISGCSSTQNRFSKKEEEEKSKNKELVKKNLEKSF